MTPRRFLVIWLAKTELMDGARKAGGGGPAVVGDDEHGAASKVDRRGARWVDHYNCARAHDSLGGQPP
jgi:hypothetical protein